MNALKSYLNSHQNDGSAMSKNFVFLSHLIDNVETGQDHIKFRGQSKEGLVKLSVNTMMIPRTVSIDISSIIKTENLTPETADTLYTICEMIENAFLEAYDDAQNKIINMVGNASDVATESKV